MRRPRPIRAIKAIAARARRRSASAARSMRRVTQNKLTRRAFLAGAAVGAVGGAAVAKYGPKIAKHMGETFDEALGESPEARKLRKQYLEGLEKERREKAIEKAIRESERRPPKRRR